MMAVENGYPARTYKKVIGNKISYYKVAEDLRGQPDSVADILNKTIQEFADSNNFWLIAYNEKDIPYRTVGGRTQEEMIKYIEELEKRGEFEEARILKQSVKDE